MEEKETSTEIVAQTKTEVIKAGTSLFFDIAKFNHAQRVAMVFASSTMVPEHFKNNIGNCVIALNLADRMKVDPFMLLQNMYVVHGRPGIEAKLAIALVNNSGKFTPLQYQYNSNKTVCYAHAQRIDTGELCEGVEVSIQMAKDEGWYSKQGSKWKTMPALMLMYRAAMFFARAYCPEALLGMQTKEELYDIVDMEPSTKTGGAYKIKEAKEESSSSKTKLKTFQPETNEPIEAETTTTVTTPPEFAALVKVEAKKDFEYVPTDKDGMAHDNLSAYIEMVSSNNDSTCEAVMNSIVSTNSFAGFWSNFLQGNWKKHFEGKLPEVKKKAEPTPEAKKDKPIAGNGNTDNNGNAFDAVDWKANRLKGAGLATYFHTNKKDWDSASEEAKASFQEKWGRVYGEDEPFPVQSLVEKKPVAENPEAPIDYPSALREYYEKEPDKLLEACHRLNYDNVVIPMGKQAQKDLYEMFQKV
ncbi:MAG: recombinase RecT [Patescibacteria group bacterium]|jgi:hypothetical protein